MSQYIYRELPTSHALRLMAWAVENKVDYFVWNAVESILGTTGRTELGLTIWPENWESI